MDKLTNGTATNAETSAAAAEHSLEIHNSNPENDFKGTLTELRRPVDKSLVKKRPGNRDRNGNVNEFDYVPWNDVADILDDTAPNWSHSIKGMQVVGDFVATTVAITINGVTREGVGTGRASDETGIKKAEHDALKRAAVKFGVARELYRKEIHGDSGSSGSSTQNTFDINKPPVSPRATGPADVVTAKQLGLVHSTCRELDINPYDECDVRLKCNLDDLNRKAASWFITYLQKLQEGKEAAHQPPSDNVSNFSGRSSSTRNTVSPETKAKLMIDNGEVTPAEHGFDVTDHAGGQAWKAQVSIDRNNSLVTCSCGEFKTAAAKGNNAFMCCHKMAVEMFVQREADAT